MKELTQEELKKLLHYNPETGLFTRLKGGSGTNNRKGVIAGCIDSKGYIRIVIKGKHYLSSQLAWFYVHGEWPENLVDHKDTIRNNNAWSNLRLATHAENMQNLRIAQKNNKSGYLGVCINRNRFQARIVHKGKQIYLGTYSTPEEAHQAYLEKKRELHEFCTI